MASVKKEKKVATKKVEEKIPAAKPKTYSIRGNILEGKVISAKARKTITVERILTQYIPKYERYKKVKSKLKVHVPQGMEVKEGDKVKIGETRKISKTKNFILMEILK
jgi:small subunit ribosomal protein S17